MDKYAYNDPKAHKYDKDEKVLIVAKKSDAKDETPDEKTAPKEISLEEELN